MKNFIFKTTTTMKKYNNNVKKFCDKYGIKVCECGIGWKVL